MSHRKSALISPADRIGLSRSEAAAYIGVSTLLFDQMVDLGYMPQPKRFNRRILWDRRQIENAFADLPEEGIQKNSEYFNLGV